MVALYVALAVAVSALLAEALHARRVRRVAHLAFGPTAQPRLWARGAPLVRAAGLGLLAWGLTTLLLIPPKTHHAQQLDPKLLRHLVLLLDVSPSMGLQDAGPTRKQARRERIADLVESFYQRAGADFKTSVVAFYNGAKPVVIDTTDPEVLRNILHDLPMHYAFEVGQTRLFDGLEEVAKIAKPWNPRSASLIILSDGDTVPATGMPKLPASISHVLLVGVGDPRVGTFIDGRQSRQDVSTLRQTAVRLGGLYHNGNEKQISTDIVRSVTAVERPSRFEELTRREYALLACLVGALAYAFLPVLLHAAGTPWRPGVQRANLPRTDQLSRNGSPTPGKGRGVSSRGPGPQRVSEPAVPV
ncbi:MAG: VWA domain-containing protein [Pirellulales bacterium]